MKVLLISDFYPPQTGGMESHVRALGIGLKAQGHDVYVATTERQDSSEVRDGIPVCKLGGTFQRMSFAYADGERRYPPPAVDPELSAKLHKLITRLRPDVIHAHGWVVYSALAANALHGVPFVNSLHDYGHFCIKRTLLREDRPCAAGRSHDCIACAKTEYGSAKSLLTFAGTSLGLKQLRGVDRFIAVSRFVKRASLPHLPHQRIHVIPNFIDPIAFTASRPTANNRPVLPRRFVLFVGVIAPFKGVDDLKAAFKMARERNSEMQDVELLLLGRDHPSAHYESDSAKNIAVIYNPARSLVVEAIHSCECMVVPSRWDDPCPTTVIEGVAAGRRVIATRAGGIPELLAGVNGAMVVPPADPSALSQALEQTCSTPTTDYRLPTTDYLPLQPERVVAESVKVYEQAIADRYANKMSRSSVVRRPSSPRRAS